MEVRAGKAIENRESRLRQARHDAARRMLVSLVGSALAVDGERLCCPGRGTAAESHARQVALYIAHTTLGLTFTEAGRLFGRDRTTAAHACRRVEEQREIERVDQFVDCLERAACRAAAGAGRA